MSDKKISQLSDATTPLAGTEELPLVQGGATKKVSVDNLTAGKTVSMSQLDAGNIRATGNTISSTNTNGDINIDPNGSGKTRIAGTSNSTVAIINGAGGLFDLQLTSGNGSVINSELYKLQLLYNNSSKNGFIGFKRSSGADSGELVLGTNTAERLVVGANVTVNAGNLVIGTSGKGIDFSATSGTGTSELLDDYEEGTWTPAFSYSTAGTSSFTYTAQTGQYTKIGNLVTVSFEISLSAFSKGTGSGAFIVTGLPFSVDASDKSTGAMSLDNTTYYADPVILTRVGWNHLLLYRNRSNNTDATFDPSATSRISGSITYRT